MDQKLQKAKDLILSHKDILVVLAARPDGDSLMATSALFLALKKIADKGPIFNLVDFLIPGKLSEFHKELVGDGILKYAKNELDARNYVINVPCGSGVIDKVSWRVENQLFKLFITPSYGDINLKEVTFDQIGSNYKLIILVGFSDLDRLGDVYSKNKVFFDKAPKLAINGPSRGNFDLNVECNSQRSVTETIYDLLKTLKVDIDAELSQLLLNGIIQRFGGQIENIESPETLESISELLNSGAVMNDVKKKSTRKSTFALLQLQQKIFANVRQNTAGVLWSKVSSYELKDLQISDEEIRIEDEIAFNFCDGYEDAFLLFELSDGRVIGRVESKTLESKSFSREYNISGYDNVLTFETNIGVDEVESALLEKFGAEEGSIKSEGFLEDEKEFEVEPEEPAELKEEANVVIVPEVLESQGPLSPLTEELGESDPSDDDSEEYNNNPIVSADDDGSFGPPKIFGSNRFGSFAGGNPPGFGGK